MTAAKVALISRVFHTSCTEVLDDVQNQPTPLASRSPSTVCVAFY
jgi:hypothetical protein